MKKRFKTAFILGAGLGERLRPYTDRCPKPLLPLRGRPIITYALDHLLEIGVERFIINTHHCPGMYDKAFPEGSWRGRPLVLRHEPSLLDTGGGLKNIEDLLPWDEAILCYNGDIVTNLPLANLIAAHEDKRPLVTLALRTSGPLLNVRITQDEIRDIRGITGMAGERGCQFAGIYAADTELLASLPPGKPESLVSLLIGEILKKPGSVRGVVIDEGFWHDLGTVAVYRKLEAQGVFLPQKS